MLFRKEKAHTVHTSVTLGKPDAVWLENRSEMG